MKKAMYVLLFSLPFLRGHAEFLEIRTIQDVEPTYKFVTDFCQSYPQESLEILSQMEKGVVFNENEWECVYKSFKLKNSPLIVLLEKSIKGAVVLHNHVRDSLRYLKQESNKLVILNLCQQYSEEPEKYYLTLVNDLSIIKTLINHYLYYQTNLYKK